MTILELCNIALNYILSINPGNYNQQYSSSGYLKEDGTGYDLAIHPYTQYYNGDGYQASVTYTLYYRTYDTIPQNYKNAISSTDIANHWNTFKEAYITKINGPFLPNVPLGLSSFLVFLYLFKCFTDARFRLYTDSHNKAYVWLYNTTLNVDYGVDTSIKPKGFTTDSLTQDMINSYINIILQKICAQDSISILNSVAYVRS